MVSNKDTPGNDLSYSSSAIPVHSNTVGYISTIETGDFSIYPLFMPGPLISIGIPTLPSYNVDLKKTPCSPIVSP